MITSKHHIRRRIINSIAACVAVFVITCVIPLAGDGQGSETTGSRLRSLHDFNLPGLDTRVNLNAFEAWDVVQLLQFLAHRGGLNNIVIGKGVQGLTTRLKFDNVTVGEALEVVLTVNNLAYVVRGGIITIMTDAEYQSLYNRSFYDEKEIKTIPLEYAEPARFLEMLAPIKSAIGTIVADPVAGTLILIDTPDKIAQMEQIIRAADLATLARVIPTETREFRLQYAEVEVLEAEVKRVISESAGFLHADARTRSLRVTDVPHNMRKVEELVALYDRRPRQVFIEAKIVQVRLQDDMQMGVRWENLFEMIDPRVRINTKVLPSAVFPDLRVGAMSEGATSLGGGSVGLSGITPGGRIDLIIEALQSVGETKLLSNPHIAVVDGEKATLQVITQEPYAEATLESGSTNVVGETIKFIDVGVELDVTPRISDDNMISMIINPSVSSKIGDYQAFRKVPIVRKSTAETSVMIKDGETIIIAGMIDNEKTKSESRVPFLGRIPLLGILFRNTQEKANSSELIVFLTPRIISGERPFLRMEDTRKQPKPMRRARMDDDGKSLKPLR